MDSLSPAPFSPETPDRPSLSIVPTPADETVGKHVFEFNGAANAIINALKAKSDVNFIETPLFSGEYQTNMERLYLLQQYWKGISEQALQYFSEGVPQVGELLDFMRNNSIYTVPVHTLRNVYVNGDGEEKDLNYEDFDGKIEVVFIPENMMGSDQSPQVSVTANGQLLRIETTFKSQEWFGIRLAHELSQIREDNFRDTTDYLKGEVEAYLLEMDMLKAWNPEGYDCLISEGGVLLDTEDYEDIFKLINSIYPTTTDIVSEKEAKDGLISCFTAIVFAKALDNGANNDDLAENYLSILRLFSGLR